MTPAQPNPIKQSTVPGQAIGDFASPNPPIVPGPTKVVSVAGAPAWQALTAYVANQIVSNGTSLYLCLQAYTSTSSFSNDFANGFWQQIAGSAGTLQVRTTTGQTAAASETTIANFGVTLQALNLPNAPSPYTINRVANYGKQMLLNASGSDSISNYSQVGTQLTVPPGAELTLQYLSGTWYVIDQPALLQVPGTFAKMVAGVISSSGSIVTGAGFTVVRNSTGLFSVTFSPALLNAPAVNITAVGGTPIVATLTAAATTNGFQVQLVNLSGAATDSEFTFEAVG